MSVDVLAHVRGVGAARPDDLVPCPVCAAAPKGRNLAAHLDKHPGARVTSSWRGRDKRVRRPFLAGLCLALLGCGALAAVDPDVAAAAVFGVVVLALALTGLEATGVLKARLTLDGDEAVLRFALGLGRRAVTPTSLEVGSLYRRRPAASAGPPSTTEGGVPTEDEPAGTYLALRDGRRRLVVGCAHGTGLRRHWQGWAQGPRRKHWDITLAPGDHVALQHVLASRGLLQPR